MRERPQLRRVLRSAIGLLLSIAFVCAWGGAAFADAGDASDPKDTNGRLDLAKVSHSDDDEYVTYRMETRDGFNVEQDFFVVQWDFDLDGDGVPQESCIQLEQIGDDEGGLQAALYPGCGPETYATATAKRDGNAIEFRFLLRDVVLGAALPADKKFGYRVTAKDRSGNVDLVPNDGLVEQGGLPNPPEPEQPAQQATEGSAQAGGAGQDEGVPPGEGPGGPEAEAPASPAGDGGLFSRSADIPMRTWVLTVGLPALVLAVIVLMTRRRRLDAPDQTPREDEDYEPLVPSLVMAGSEESSIGEAPNADAYWVTKSTSAHDDRVEARLSASDPWYMPSAPMPKDPETPSPAEPTHSDGADQTRPWGPWSGSDPGLEDHL